MKIKTNSDLTSGVLFFVLSLILYLLVPSQIATKETSDINAQTFPLAMIVITFVCSIVLIIQGLQREKKTYVIGKEFFHSEKLRDELFTVVFMLMIALYIVLLSKIGFLVSSLLLVIGVLVYYGSKKWYYYAIGCANVFLAYYIFNSLLGVSLP